MDAIGIVLDVGAHMQNVPAGYTTPIESSVECLKMLIQRNLFAEKKDEYALILCGTEATSNDLADDDGNFENISVVRELLPLNWDVLEFLNKGVDTQQSTGDLIDAIMVAADILVKHTEGKKTKIQSKRILIFSNLDGLCNSDEIDHIAKRLKKVNIELLLVGADLDDDEDGDGGNQSKENNDNDGSDEKPKSENQVKNEGTMRTLIKILDGASWTFDDALPTLSYFETRGVSQRAWPVEFEISDDFKIKINGYTKVKAAKPKSMKNVYAKDPDEPIKTVTSYHKLDEAETEVDVEDTVKGYRYGNTLVPFSDEDMQNMKLTVEKCMKLLCFTSAENVPVNLYMGDSVLVFTADPNNESAQLAFSALVNALYEKNDVAIVRRVYNRATAPRIGVLVPKIKGGYEALEYVQLPFAEDIRRFTFGSLPLNSMKDDEIPPQVRKFKPSEEQLSAVDKLITEMDIGKERCANELDCEEPFKPSHCVNPYIQHLYSCAAKRALDPSHPIMEPNPMVLSCLEPPSTIAAATSLALDKMNEVFTLKRHEETRKKRTAETVFGEDEDGAEGSSKQAKTNEDQNENANVSFADALRVHVDHVGSVDPISDFQEMVTRGHINEAVEQMERRIDQLVTDSFGDQFYPKAMACLRALRAECIRSHMSVRFNKFLREWKTSLQAGSKRPFWDIMIRDKLTLISVEEDNTSDASSSDATSFLPDSNENAPKKAEEPDGEDIDDLLADMD